MAKNTPNRTSPKDVASTKDEQLLLKLYRGIASPYERQSFLLLMKAVAWGAGTAAATKRDMVAEANTIN